MQLSYDRKNYVNLRGGNNFNYQHGRTRTNSNGWTSRYGQYLTHAHKHITRTVARYNSETAVHTSLGLITPSSIRIIWHNNNNTKAKSSDCPWLGHLQTNPEILGVAHIFLHQSAFRPHEKGESAHWNLTPSFKLLSGESGLRSRPRIREMRFQKCSYSQLSLTDTSLRQTPL